jgi:hypothetical protein
MSESPISQRTGDLTFTQTFTAIPLCTNPPVLVIPVHLLLLPAIKVILINMSRSAHTGLSLENELFEPSVTFVRKIVILVDGIYLFVSYVFEILQREFRRNGVDFRMKFRVVRLFSILANPVTHGQMWAGVMYKLTYMTSTPAIVSCHLLFDVIMLSICSLYGNNRGGIFRSVFLL